MRGLCLTVPVTAGGTPQVIRDDQQHVVPGRRGLSVGTGDQAHQPNDPSSIAEALVHRPLIVSTEVDPVRILQ